jgi:hypothetical protein
MDKQIKNITLLPDGRIRFKTGRIEMPKNKVTKIEEGVVYFLVNKDKYEVVVDIDDYFRLSLWAHRLTLDHKLIRRGVVAYDNGYEHKSLPAAIKQTTKGYRVTYVDKNHLNCRKENLTVKANRYLFK